MFILYCLNKLLLVLTTGNILQQNVGVCLKPFRIIGVVKESDLLKALEISGSVVVLNWAWHTFPKSYLT